MSDDRQTVEPAVPENATGSVSVAQGWLLVFYFFTALLLGAITMSLWHAYRLATGGQPGGSVWLILGSAGSFWSGHIGALSLVFLAWGFYFQARSLRKEAHAERKQASTDRAAMRRWMLQTIDSRRDEMAKPMEAVVAYSIGKGKWVGSKLSGKMAATQLHREIEDIQRQEGLPPFLHLRIKEMNAYLLLIQSGIEILDEAPEAERRTLAAIYGFTEERDAIGKIIEHLESEREEHKNLVNRICGEDDAVREQLAAAMVPFTAEGWKFGLSDYISARILTACRVSLAAEACEVELPCVASIPIHEQFQTLFAQIVSEQGNRSKIGPRPNR